MSGLRRVLTKAIPPAGSGDRKGENAMTCGTLNASVPVLQKLVGQNLHLRQAYQLTKIVKKINEEMGFFQSKYAEIMNSDKPDEDKIKMADELLNFEVDWPLDPIVFTLDDDVRLSAADLDVAQGLIEIKE